MFNLLKEIAGATLSAGKAGAQQPAVGQTTECESIVIGSTKLFLTS